MSGTKFSIEVQPRIPPQLQRLEEFANDLVYSWDRQIRALFLRLDRSLWDRCGHNPKIFLRRVDQRKLEEAVEDPAFLQDYARVCSTYDAYLARGIQKDVVDFFSPDDLVSYSCAEFGLHESLPIYSGGLGILAGDHCKAASDLGMPFVALGILYRQGYFTQQIDGHGNQVVHYTPSSFGDLPIRPALDGDGRQHRFVIDVAGRQIHLQIWLAQIGHVTLYLLDSDLEQNSDQDRSITYQLYGGDANNRLLQEIVLGIGGVRAHRLLGLHPTVWHINEGHAAFQIIERCRELVATGMDFFAALERVAACTVFTTHTPVPAGHDIFDVDLIKQHFSDYVAELGITMKQFLAIGNSPANDRGFNMTALAMRGSRFHNGVSRIHGEVASKMESYVWPELAAEENPIGHITNGVHIPTFLANEWSTTFDTQFGGGWRNQLLSRSFWHNVDAIPDHSFWSVRQLLKSKLMEEVEEKYVAQLRRNGVSESRIRRLTANINPQKTDVLTIGFARRFATYKRAALIFSDLDRLRRLLGDPERPVVLIFAGKAHPHDIPGQDLIRRIHEISHHPDFEGKVVLLENYNMAMARKLVTGVDVWLNTPIHPLEASGTSGQKAAINGVLNLSVLDGWWAEGFNGENGWEITPHGPRFSDDFRDHEEARELLDKLENEVIPLYYRRDGHGYSPGWIRKSKAAMKSLIPDFNSQRMVRDYIVRYYAAASSHGKRLCDGELESAATRLARWKHKVRSAWPEVRVNLLHKPEDKIYRDDEFQIKVNVFLGGLSPDDIAVETLISADYGDGRFAPHSCFQLRCESESGDGNAVFSLAVNLAEPGAQAYMVRIYPHHEHLAHKFEMGCMKWV